MVANSRQKKYDNWKKFFDRSKDIFLEHQKNDTHSHDLSETHGFCPVPGGNGKQDEHLVEIFFGNRPIDNTTQLVPNQSGKTPRRVRFLCEAGALLQYSRQPSGAVTCLLMPAQVENMPSREDFIVLGRISDPLKLLDGSKTRGHWRCLVSYMRCTYIDGNPNLLDRARTAWIRFTRLRVVKNEDAGIVLWKWFCKTASFLLTVGLSGFLLLLFPMLYSKMSTPDVSTVQVVHEQLATTVVRDAEAKRLDEIAATISTISYDINFLKSLTDAPIAVKVIKIPEQPKGIDTLLLAPNQKKSTMPKPSTLQFRRAPRTIASRKPRVVQ